MDGSQLQLGCSNSVGRSGSYFALAGVLAIATGFLLPGNAPPYAGFYREIFSWAGLLFLCAAAMLFSHHRLQLPRSALFLLLLSILPLLQYLSGLVFYFGDAFLAAIYLAGFALAIITGLSLAKGKPIWIEVLAWCLLISALLSSGIAFGQWLSLDFAIGEIGEFPFSGSPSGNLGQRNNFSTLVLMGVGSMFYLQQLKRFRPVFGDLLLLIFVIAIAVSQSRTPWVATGVLLVWTWWKRDLLEDSGRQLLRITIAVLFYLLLTQLLLQWLADALLFSSDATYSRSAVIDARITIWSRLLQAVTSGDLGGYGWRQVGVAMVLNAGMFGNIKYGEYVQNSHNLFLDLLVWSGPLIGSVLILAILWWAWRQVRDCATAEHFYLLCIIGAIAVHAQLEYPQEYGYFLVPVGILIGAVERYSRSVPIEIPMPVLPAAALVVLAFSILFVVQSDYRALQKAHRGMVFFNLLGGEMLEMRKPKQEAHLLTELKGHIDFGYNRAREKMSDQELLEMHKAALRYPHLSSLFRYALALGLNDRQKEAASILDAMRKLYGEERYTLFHERWLSQVAIHPQLESVAIGGLAE